MKSAPAFPALGEEYDDPEDHRPPKRVVYGILGLVGVVLVIMSAVGYEAGYRAFELGSSYF